jgi:hypothetical protein
MWMRNIKRFFIVAIVFETLTSCLVPLAPKFHYFVSTDNFEKSIPKVSIFSTPSYKNYVVTDIDTNAQVFIRSPVFENPEEFYAMENQNTSAKQYKFQRRDGKFYRTADYTHITLKIIDHNSEKTINYSISKK